MHVQSYLINEGPGLALDVRASIYHAPEPGRRAERLEDKRAGASAFPPVRAPRSGQRYPPEDDPPMETTIPGPLRDQPW